MEIIKKIATRSDCYKAGKHMVPVGIMVHSTGAPNPYLSRYVGPNKYANDWNQPGVNKMAHAFIGKQADGSVAAVQTLPWDMRGWHAGGPANKTHISFEICEDGLDDRAYFNQVYGLAVELCAHLCKTYGIRPDAIICHSEGHARGIASNHADVMHWFPKFGKSMDTLRADVATELAKPTTIKPDPHKPDHWAAEAWAWATAAGITDGTNPRGPATREQVIQMLYRYNNGGTK